MAESKDEKTAFMYGWASVETEVYETAVAKGWWNEDRNDGECIALIHSELSEALEALRRAERRVHASRAVALRT